MGLEVGGRAAIEKLSRTPQGSLTAARGDRRETDGNALALSFSKREWWRVLLLLQTSQAAVLRPLEHEDSFPAKSGHYTAQINSWKWCLKRCQVSDIGYLNMFNSVSLSGHMQVKWWNVTIIQPNVTTALCHHSVFVYSCTVGATCSVISHQCNELIRKRSLPSGWSIFLYYASMLIVHK